MLNEHLDEHPQVPKPEFFCTTLLETSLEDLLLSKGLGAGKHKSREVEATTNGRSKSGMKTSYP